MPLPGGPSDKLGNRYELRWIVRRIVDLITGRLEWIRIEPPGENAIEFRCRATAREEAHQVKRGHSNSGHWTMNAMSDVLDGFGHLLASQQDLHCIFVSEHAANELKELTERARSALNATEFGALFLSTKQMANARQQLQSLWRTNDEGTWARLQRIIVITVGEVHIQEETDAILQLLVSSPEAARAILTELALESVHQELRKQQVIERLTERSIRCISTPRSTTVFMPMTSPPPATGLRRQVYLQRLTAHHAAGVGTVFLGGIAGIGKSTVASQFAAEWPGAVCWIESALMASSLEAIGLIGEFSEKMFGDNTLLSALRQGQTHCAPLAKLAGKVFGAHKGLIVWDGLDGDCEQFVRPLIDSISVSVIGGMQIVTTQEQDYVKGGPSSIGMHVDRLDKDEVRRILIEAYPESRVRDLEDAESLVQGHPYLVYLIIGAAQNLDLRTVLASIEAGAGVDPLAAQVLANVSEKSLGFLTVIAWMGISFRAGDVEMLGGTRDVVIELASRYLILRVGDDKYRVHDIIRRLIRRKVGASESLELHQRAALFLQGLESPSWLEIRTMLFHAHAASMRDLVKHAGASLLQFAMDAGLWPLAHEAAETMVDGSVGSEDWFPLFVLGKCKRMRDERESALDQFEMAEVLAEEPRAQEMIRYERASVLHEMGKLEEAEPMYRELSGSCNPAIQVASQLAIGFGVAQRGDTDSAIVIMQKAAETAKINKVPREEAEVWQAFGRVLANATRWKEAHECLLKANAIRSSLSGAEARDVYGWYHLLETAFEVECALGNDRGARDAARSLWSCSLRSGNVAWESNAAYAMCVSYEDKGSSDLDHVVGELRIIGGDVVSPPSTRIAAWNGVVHCEWTRRKYMSAMEAVLSILALSLDENVEAPLIGHMQRGEEMVDDIMPIPGGYVLMLPPGETEDFITRTVSAVLESRPELATYAVLRKFSNVKIEHEEPIGDE